MDSAATPLASTERPIDRLLAVMRQLRDPVSGCEWDIAQSFATIAPYTIEEAYELSDAIDHGDPAAIRDELGDMLLQVVFHAQIAADAGLFRFDDVADAIAAKMIRRHPHIFADGHDLPQRAAWEAIKAVERASATTAPVGALAGVAKALPALKRADKLQARAARVGFDWPDVSGPLAKVREELGELDAATTDTERAEEMGDLLFAVANLARKLGVDPETALTAANLKFERRFAAMEALNDGTIDGLNLDAQEALWQRVKVSEAGRE
jgi:nucleoside triphosphate diphosphatase